MFGGAGRQFARPTLVVLDVREEDEATEGKASQEFSSERFGIRVRARISPRGGVGPGRRTSRQCRSRPSASAAASSLAAPSLADGNGSSARVSIVRA